MILKGYSIKKEWKKTTKFEGSVMADGNGRFVEATKDGVTFFLKASEDPVLEYSPESFKYQLDKRLKTSNKLKSSKLNLNTILFDEDIFEYQLEDGETRILGASKYIVPELKLPIEKVVKLSNDDKLKIVNSMVFNLNTIHTAGVIHGDVKSSNFIFSKNRGGDYFSYLIDFDNSYPLDLKHSSEKMLPNSPGFESPEVIDHNNLGEAKRDKKLPITEKTDIFSLGIVVVEVFTGLLPNSLAGDIYKYPESFSIPNYKQLMFKINSKSDNTYLSLVNWMLQRYPANRPSTEQVMKVLSGELDIDFNYLHQSELDGKWQKLWGNHSANFKLKPIEILKEFGVEKLTQQLNVKSKDYSIRIKGKDSIVKIEDLLDLKLVELIDGVSDVIPGFEVVSNSELIKAGVLKIKTIDKSKMIFDIYYLNGDKFKNNLTFLKVNKLIRAIKEVKVEVELIDEAIDNGEISICDPWPVDEIKFVGPSEFKKLGYIKVERAEKSGFYIVYTDKGSILPRERASNLLIYRIARKA
jgi:serine/threonine protein kinase